MKHLRIVSELSVRQCGRCCRVFAGFPVIEVSVSEGGDLFFRLCSHGDVQRSCYTAPPHPIIINCCVSLYCFTSFIFPLETTKPENSKK